MSSTCSAITLKFSERASLIVAVDHRLVHAVAREIAHERAVDLQVVHRQVLQVGERTEVAAEIVQRELAAHAVQHADETPRGVEVRDHRALGDLEADLRGIHAAAVEALDHELEELRIGDGLARQVDARGCGRRGKLDGAAPERRERGLHHPAIDEPHQAIAFGGTHELHAARGRVPARPTDARSTSIAGPRPLSPYAAMMGCQNSSKRLSRRRVLQDAQPLDLAALARDHFVARRIHHDAGRSPCFFAT